MIVSGEHQRDSVIYTHASIFIFFLQVDIKYFWHLSLKKKKISFFHWIDVKWSEVTHSCPNICNSMDCSLPGSSNHGIFQARLLEWVAISFSRGIFLTQGLNPGLLHYRQTRLFTLWATRKSPKLLCVAFKLHTAHDFFF